MGKSTPCQRRGLAIRPGGKGEMADISKHHARQPRTTSGEFTTPESSMSDKSQSPRISRSSRQLYLTSLTPYPIQPISSFAPPKQFTDISKELLCTASLAILPLHSAQQACPRHYKADIPPPDWLAALPKLVIDFKVAPSAIFRCLGVIDHTISPIDSTFPST